ncbi:uncharacterized protein LOC117640063 [Thrips palmi]|uniref:Uncharacterized protein LOC117640063 n=1 Tax=Thrips palmi TaxID=161013 RepID=A0A6P8ZHN8_THRPL|nr:uncharacterized protein LOC117640063 [Thrips palmi]
MDVDSWNRMRNNLAHLFIRDGDSNANHETNGSDMEDSEDSVPSSLLSLPTFRALKEISDRKQEIVTLENELHLKRFIKGFDKVQTVVYDGLELWNQVATCLEFLHSSSLTIQQALKDPMAEDALPLPHHLHSKAIQTVEDCLWIIQQRGWQPMAFEVDWDNLVMKLQQEVSNITISSKMSEKHLNEVISLKSKLDTFLRNLPSFKRI